MTTPSRQHRIVATDAAGRPDPSGRWHAVQFSEDGLAWATKYRTLDERDAAAFLAEQVAYYAAADARDEAELVAAQAAEGPAPVQAHVGQMITFRSPVVRERRGRVVEVNGEHLRVRVATLQRGRIRLDRHWTPVAAADVLAGEGRC